MGDGGLLAEQYTTNAYCASFWSSYLSASRPLKGYLWPEEDPAVCQHGQPREW